MGYFEDMLENTEEHALFFEIYMEEWSLLLELDKSERKQLYSALEAVLQRLDCPAQGMKVIGDHLYMVIQMSVDRTIQEILDTLEETAIACLSGRHKNPGPESCSVYFMTATDVIDAVILLHQGK
jgi:hypothetical protein